MPGRSRGAPGPAPSLPLVLALAWVLGLWLVVLSLVSAGAVLGRQRSLTRRRVPSAETGLARLRRSNGRAGVADAVGVRIYVPATGMGCDQGWDRLWGLSSFPCEGQDWVIDYVAFVRGQYHVTVAVGDDEGRPPELDTQRTIALDLAAEATRAACEVEVSAGARRSCTSPR